MRLVGTEYATCFVFTSIGLRDSRLAFLGDLKKKKFKQNYHKCLQGRGWNVVHDYGLY
jgi:hypothetical protein